MTANAMEPDSNAIEAVSQLLHEQGPDDEPRKEAGTETEGGSAPDRADNAGEHDRQYEPGDDTIAEIGRLLSDEGMADAAGGEQGGTAEHDDGVTSDDTGDAEVNEGVTVKALAEKLELDPADIYNELQIPLGDGETVTLGEWKDRVKSLQDVDAERQTVTDMRNEHEKQLLQLRSEFNELMALVPEDSRAAMTQHASAKSQRYVQEQEVAVLEAIPEWKDQDSLAKDRAGIVDMGGEYGFSEQEITYTHDARTLRWMHDHLRLRERAKSLETQLKEIKTAAKGKRVPNQPNKPARGKKLTKQGRLAMAMQKAKASGSDQAKEAVVSHLLRSQ